MREIKFRAWDKKYEDMLYSDVQTEEYEFRFTENRIEVYGYSDDFTNPMNVELMQFTGLYDKNGKEIYEGDIIVGKFTDIGVDTGLVVFKGYGFKVEIPSVGDDDLVDWERNCESIEVIGNIYENPERLEGDLAE